MKLEQQVLSIEQVQELLVLGFDVEKYASMCWLEQTPFIPIEQPKEYGLEILTDSLMCNRGNLDAFPTLTIGDIIGILPKEISIVNKDIPLKLLTDMKSYLRYSSVSDIISIKQTETFINMLFETLKWCIKEKHIEL